MLSIWDTEYSAHEGAVKKWLSLRQVWRIILPGWGIPCFPVFEGN